MGNLGKDYTGQRTLLVLFIIYSHQYQPPSSPSWSFWHVPPVQGLQLSQSTFIIALSSPRYFSRAQKALPHKGSSVNILVCSDYSILAHVPFHQRTRKMWPGWACEGRRVRNRNCWGEHHYGMRWWEYDAGLQNCWRTWFIVLGSMLGSSAYTLNANCSWTGESKYPDSQSQFSG